MGNCLNANGVNGGAPATTTDDREKAAGATTKNQEGRGKGATSNRIPSNGNRSTVHSLHEGLLHEQTSDVYAKYEEVEVLGTGSMGHVSRVRIKQGGSAYRTATSGTSDSDRLSTIAPRKTSSNISEGRKFEYALKSIQLNRVSPAFVDELSNEIDILKTMDHPNIVRLHEVFYQRNKQIFLILELCDGGDLYTRLPYTEKDSAYITGKLLSAVKYMHDHGIVHRDLKFENIMFETKSPTAEIKVIDFGLSKKFVSKKIGVMHEGVGTLYSMAPQVLQGVYTSQADMWSCGVITYMLLSSHRPFYNKQRKIMIDRIMRCDYTFEKDYWLPVSAEAKDFISNLLVLDPKIRFNAAQAQKHVWLSKEFKLSDRAPTASFQSAVADNLLMYKDTAELKKVALNIIAHRSSTEEILQLRKCFDAYDTANNGVISFEEFREALKQSNYSDADIKEMFDSVDVNENGHVMYTEFIAATLEAQGQVEEERIAEAFERLDSDNSGFISKENMLDFLGEDATPEDVENMLKHADLDNDGQISFAEFLAMFRTQTKKLSLTDAESFDSKRSDDANLVGLDAKIPGGKYDSDLDVGTDQGVVIDSNP
ncbi:serine/threonine protein kinase [Nitzschia inconspicua]|uniref:Serine/threonine protein kinase n=1 Tax=Nitzschia inconspicua TaxID=303405 RepID=A0A9K3L5D1_9STRA|nr:serine/threonine protein kinase [Nitzschia inconspicua]